MGKTSVNDDKAQVIVEAALLLFSRYGYRRASVDDIAREAGVAKGTVYLYFDSKEEIFRAVSRKVIDRFLGDAEKARAAAGSLAERLHGVLAAKFGYLFEIVHSSPHAPEIVDSKNSLAKDLFVRADRRYYALVAELLAEADRQGDIDLGRAGLSANAAAALIIRCAHGNGAADETGALPSLTTFNRRLSEMVRVLVLGLGGRRER